LRTWGILLILILLAGSATLVPAISDQFRGSPTRAKPEAQTIEIGLPVPVNGADSVTLTSLQALGALAGVVAVVVIGAGVVLAFGYVLLSRQVTSVTESSAYQEHLAALTNREQEQINKLRADRVVDSVPEHNMPRWSVISTSLIILLFVISFGMLVNRTFVPEGEYLLNGRMVNSAITVVGGFVVLALAVILWRIRPKTLAAIESTSDQSIPWDFIWVLLTGVLVVGLGIGFIVYLNVPA